MTRKIFISLPVTDLAKSKAFYEALGFIHNPQFSDETAAGMDWSETIFLMIMTHEKWREFTDRPIPPKGASEVMLCLSCDSRAEVEELNARAGRCGGTSDINPVQDHGVMLGRDFADPDGHAWGAMWMDSGVAAGGPPVEATGTAA